MTIKNLEEEDVIVYTQAEMEQISPENRKLFEYTQEERLSIMKEKEFTFRLFTKDDNVCIGEFKSKFKTTDVINEIDKITTEKLDKPFNCDYTTLLLHLKTITGNFCYRRRHSIKNYYLRVEGFPEAPHPEIQKNIKKEFNSPQHILLKKTQFYLYNIIEDKELGFIQSNNFKNLYVKYVDKTNKLLKSQVPFNKAIKKLLSMDEGKYVILESIKITRRTIDPNEVMA